MGEVNPATTSVDRRRHSLRHRWWWFVALAALLVAAGIFAGLGASKQPNTVVLARSPSGSKARASAAPKLAPLKRSRPTELTIPALSVATSLETLGLQADHQVMVPTTVHIAGWYIDGPAPGQMGSAVILGHVDSTAGPGVFFDLRTLAAGDVVDVGLSDGVTAQFTVDSVAQYSKLAFPAQRVYGSHGSSALQLVTCGGVFDHQTGSYLSNIVVYTSLTAVVPAPASTTPPPQPAF